MDTTALDNLLAAILGLAGLFVLAQTWFYGNSKAVTCNAPRKAGGRCQNTVNRADRCAAGHDRGWVGLGYFLGFLLLAAAIVELLFKFVTALAAGS